MLEYFLLVLEYFLCSSVGVSEYFRNTRVMGCCVSDASEYSVSVKTKERESTVFERWCLRVFSKHSSYVSDASE